MSNFGDVPLKDVPKWTSSVFKEKGGTVLSVFTKLTAGYRARYMEKNASFAPVMHLVLLSGALGYAATIKTMREAEGAGH